MPATMIIRMPQRPKFLQEFIRLAFGEEGFLIDARRLIREILACQKSGSIRHSTSKHGAVTTIKWVGCQFAKKPVVFCLWKPPVSPT